VVVDQFEDWFDEENRDEETRSIALCLILFLNLSCRRAHSAIIAVGGTNSKLHVRTVLCFILGVIAAIGLQVLADQAAQSEEEEIKRIFRSIPGLLNRN